MFHVQAFEVDGRWEEIDKEKSYNGSIKLHKFPQTHLQECHSKAETNDSQNIDDLFFIDAEMFRFFDIQN